MSSIDPQVAAAASELPPMPSPLSRMGSAVVRYIQRVGDLKGKYLLGHILILGFIAWAPMVLLSWGVQELFPSQRNANFFAAPPLRIVLEITLAAPLVETLLMRYLFMLLRKFTQRTVLLCLISGVIWALAHADFAGWGVHAIWPFFLMGLCYLRLEPTSQWRAVWVTMMIHGVCNGVSYGLHLVLNLFFG
jgi:membrane protease YdiL (CAAX protease family)